MKPRSDKRAKQELEYKKLCREIDKEAKENGEWFCFFCGKNFKRGDIIQHHHLCGREGNLLTDKENICLCHQLCHATFHDQPVRKHPWRDGFLERLREKNLKLYYKEREKENK